MLFEGIDSLMRIALKRWIKTESLYHKKEDSLPSLEASDTRLLTVVLNCVWHHESQMPAARKQNLTAAYYYSSDNCHRHSVNSV